MKHGKESSMHNFTYHSPTKVIFGRDTVGAIVPELQGAGISRVLLLTGGKSVFDSGLHARVGGLLAEAGIAHETVRGVQPNPRVSKAREAARVAAETGAQAIVPIGGGSVFDTAKAVAGAVASKGDVWDIVEGRHPLVAALPVYGILTLSGTSSEINNMAVLNNEETRDKTPIGHPLLFPRVSIVDPSLQFSVPLQQVRYGGFDAVVHVLEAYLGAGDTAAVIDEHSEAYVRSLMRCLADLPGRETEYALRSELAFCASYAHSGWASIGRSMRGDFTSHRIGHALGALYDLPHAVTLSVLMPNWMQYILDQGIHRELFARFATRLMGVPDSSGDAAQAGIDAFREFIHSLDMPSLLRDVNVTKKDIPVLAEVAARTLPFGAPVPMDLARITEVLEYSL